MAKHHDGLIYTMVLVSAADREMTDAEMLTIGEMVRDLPVFGDYDGDDLTSAAEECAELLAQEDGLDRIAKKLRKVFGEGDLVITRGGDGMSLFEGTKPRCDVATIGQEVFDVQGAGDTTIAILATARAAGASLLEAAILANAGASVVVEQAGTATASRAQIAARLPTAITAAEEGLK